MGLFERVMEAFIVLAVILAIAYPGIDAVRTSAIIIAGLLVGGRVLFWYLNKK